MRLDKKKMIAAAIVACTTLFIAIGIHEKKDTRKQLKFGATYMLSLIHISEPTRPY